LGKFDSIANEGIFHGYSSRRKDYRCYNVKVHEEGHQKMKTQVNVQANEPGYKEEK
jgi:hypothetical protein